MGLLAGLGYTFRDNAGNPLPALAADAPGPGPRASTPPGGPLAPPGSRSSSPATSTNPLTGPTGAAAVYGPQKGADHTTVRVAGCRA